MVRRVNEKLAPKFYGPYKIIDRVGQVAYKLELPPEAKVHATFHCSQLKKCHDLARTAVDLPTFLKDPSCELISEVVLERHMVKRGRVAATKVLVQWQGRPIDDSTWEFLYDLKKKFPNFNP